MRVQAIINPAAGRQVHQKKAEKVIVSLLADGTFSTVDTIYTAGPGDAFQAMRRLDLKAVDLVLAVGGDGTVHEVVNGLMAGHAATPLAILAAGTDNDLPEALQLPRSVESFCAMIRRGRSLDIDLGRINDQYFLNVAAGGMLSDLTFRVTNGAKTILGHLAYVLEGTRDLQGIIDRSRPLVIRTSDLTIQDDILMFAVANSTRVGGFNRLAPAASVCDGLFDVLVVRKQNARDFLALVLQILGGAHLNNPTISYFQTSELQIECLDDQPFSLAVDGELGGCLPATIVQVPRSLRLIVP